MRYCGAKVSSVIKESVASTEWKQRIVAQHASADLVAGD